MNVQSQEAIQRDTGTSVFTEILARCEETCEGFLAAVFFDEEGETIDYHSYMDPFETKLLAAYCGVIMSQATFRSRWLEMGDLDRLVFFSDKIDSLILPIGEGLGVIMVVESGHLDRLSKDAFVAVIDSLKEEAGI